MGVVLYATITVNGFIATADDDTPWSDESWESFAFQVNKIKNIIIGRRTFEIMKKHGDFEKIGNPFTVIVSTEEHESDSNFIFVYSPEEALNVLKERGFAEALIAGGSILNSSCMQKGLIDELYVDVEPLVFGKGISLFSASDFQVKLELQNVKKLSKNIVQLHYTVQG